MSIDPEKPDWLCRARKRWACGGVPAGLDEKWSPYWIKRFLGYLEKRNDGRLPVGLPSYSEARGFENFIRERWKAEDWKVEQAGKAVDWLLDAAGSHAAEAEPAAIPARDKVDLVPYRLAPLEQLESHFLEEGGMETIVRITARRKSRALETEKSYVLWVGQFRRWWNENAASDLEIRNRDQAG